MRAMQNGRWRRLILSLALVVPVSVVLFALGWSTGVPAFAVMIVLPTILIGALVLTPAITDILGDQGARLLGSTRAAQPRPPLSIGERLVVQERYEDALSAYLGLTVDHPNDPAIWGRVFEIAAVHLGDLHRLQTLHAFATAEVGDPAARADVDRRYLLHLARHPDGEDHLVPERARLQQQRQLLGRIRSLRPIG